VLFKRRRNMDGDVAGNRVRMNQVRKYLSKPRNKSTIRTVLLALEKSDA
jgi:hypothetical protein